MEMGNLTSPLTDIVSVSKNGKSLCLVLRARVLAALGLHAGDRVVLTCDNGVGTFARLSLQDLAARLDPKNHEGQP